MIALLLAIKDKQSEHGIAMDRFYDHFNISRQGFHQAVDSMKRIKVMMSDIARQVSAYRLNQDCRAGSRSLYYNLRIKEQFAIGVNKFEVLMAEYGLTLKPLRLKVVTTKSVMQSWNYPNLANNLSINNINQLVVGDLTYVYIGGKRYFLFCLTDVYSARIVGHHIGKRMRRIEAKSALQKWVKLRGSAGINNCIHHTDGGSQYFAEKYLTALIKHEVKISCAKSCLQNGYAEQRNGLLKHHLFPTLKTNEEQKVSRGVARIIYRYNHKRKQQALGWKSPVEFERSLDPTSGGLVRKLHNFSKPKNGF